MPAKIDSFTAVQASRITGIPYRTIDHWARTALIVPSIAQAKGPGTDRLYSLTDLIALRVVRELRHNGISLKSLHRVVDFLHSKKNLQNPLSEARLAVVGSDVVAFDGCKDLMSVLDRPGQGVFFFMVDIKGAIEFVHRGIEELRAA
jgi:DNA-binding transcriptional MerR regulator